MSILLYLLKAWVIGIAVAAPVGPIGMLCIKKTLDLGIRGGLLVGLGAALADSTYGLIAALGLSAISHILLDKAHIIQLLGGLFLLYLAYKEAKSEMPNKGTHVTTKHAIKLVSKVFLLTITNPMTILSFIAIFASIGGETASAVESVAMVVGIFLGSMTWWCILGSVIVKLHHKLPKSWLERIKWISCFILAGFGAFSILGTLIKYVS
jgi:putative LysE/RhtB family amino acid efflux pump